MVKPIPSLERMKTCFNYDEATGIFTHALARQGVKLGARADRWASRGYRRIKIDYVEYPAHRCAWLIVHGAWPPDEVDHINGVRDDNRIENLRLADRYQQMRNTQKPVTSRNRLKGVTKVKSGRGHLWRAQITHMGEHIYIGWYPTEEIAADAYMDKARMLSGEFASNRVMAGG